MKNSPPKSKPEVPDSSSRRLSMKERVAKHTIKMFDAQDRTTDTAISSAIGQWLEKYGAAGAYHGGLTSLDAVATKGYRGVSSWKNGKLKAVSAVMVVPWPEGVSGNAIWKEAINIYSLGCLEESDADQLLKYIILEAEKTRMPIYIAVHSQQADLYRRYGFFRMSETVYLYYPDSTLDSLSKDQYRLIAAQIRALRQAQHPKMTQGDLAGRMGISSPTMIKIEKGIRRVKKIEIELLSTIFGVTPDKIIGVTDIPKANLPPKISIHVNRGSAARASDPEDQCLYCDKHEPRMAYTYFGAAVCGICWDKYWREEDDGKCDPPFVEIKNELAGYWLG